MCIYMVIYEKNKPILYHNSSKEEIMLVLFAGEEAGGIKEEEKHVHTKKKCSIIFSFVLSFCFCIILLLVFYKLIQAHNIRTNTHSLYVFSYFIQQYKFEACYISMLSQFDETKVGKHSSISHVETVHCRYVYKGS